MNRHLLLILLATFPSTHAATHAVLPGEAIQPKIDAAAPGDIIAVFGGTYPGDVTINKAVRLVEVDGQDVTITGNVTWNNVTNAPPFEGFTVGSSGKGITVNNTTGLVIKNVDARAGTGLRIISVSNLSVIGGFSSNIYQDGGHLSVNGSAVTGNFETTLNSLQTISLRTSVGSTYIWRSVKSSCAYSSGRYFRYYGVNGSLAIIGCKFDLLNYYVWGSEYDSNYGNTGYCENYAIDVYGSANSVVIANTQIRGIAFGYRRHSNQGYPHVDARGRGIYVSGDQKSLVANNYVEMTAVHMTHPTGDGAIGIVVESSKSKVYNNIIEGASYGISGPFGADVQNNCLYGIRVAAGSGTHVPVNSMNANPAFVANEKPKLQAISPCVNAGTINPIFNDLDGSQNDIGPSGGCLFDPEGWTTNKPVVISFDLAPQQLLKGVDTQVNLSNGQAVAQP